MKTMIRLSPFKTSLTIAILSFYAMPLQAQFTGATPVSSTVRSGFNSITQNEARETLQFLAGPSFYGRNPTQAGYAASAGFAAGYFRALGLKPAGENGSYFQRIALDGTRIDTTKSFIQSGNLRAKLEHDFNLYTGLSNRNISAKLVFVHLPRGAKFDAVPWSTYKNRIIVLSPSARDIVTHQLFAQAEKLGLSAVLQTVPDFKPRSVNWALNLAKFPIAKPNMLPYAEISTDFAKRLAQEHGAERFLEYSQGEGGVTSTEESTLNTTVHLQQERARFESINVLARLEGRDAALRREAVMLGAHLDHLGARSNGTFWGADDNASGVTATLLAARALSQNSVRPRRSVIFALWTSEESGLLGSRFWTKQPTVPLSQVVAYLNLDMVGRDGTVPDFGSNKPEVAIDAQSMGLLGQSLSTDFYNLSLAQNRFVNFKVRPMPQALVNASDTGPFAEAKIPTAFLSSGLHNDYHRPSDTPEKINYVKLTNAAKWAYLITFEAANRTTRIKPGKTQ